MSEERSKSAGNLPQELEDMVTELLGAAHDAGFHVTACLQARNMPERDDGHGPVIMVANHACRTGFQRAAESITKGMEHIFTAKRQEHGFRKTFGTGTGKSTGHDALQAHMSRKVRA